MIAELGHFSLILALIAGLIQGFLPLAGTALGVRSWVNVARPAVFANAVFCTFAFCCLAWCFYTSDFSVMNVANNSNSMLPWFYRLSATWGSHEGSILFWTLLLALWGLAVAVCSRRLPQDVMARVIGVMGLISVGLTLFMLLTSDPFIRLFPAAHEGRDLNPLLQDPGMVFHPPLLYMGYVGMVVPFAFAVAALIGGRLDAAWARWTRPWTSAAWIFLTLGISLGSYCCDRKTRLLQDLDRSSGSDHFLSVAAWHFPRPFRRAHQCARFRSEAMLLVNNVLLVVAMLAVLLGTLYPLFIDALNAGKISVGPLVRWKDAKISDIVKRTAWCFIAAVILGAATPLIKGWSTPKTSATSRAISSARSSNSPALGGA